MGLAGGARRELWRAPRHALLRVVLAVTCCILALAGCRTSRADEPSVGWPPTPALAAQRTLIEDARAHLRAERPGAAVQVLGTLLARHPDSPFVPEMRWLLGRAHELNGDPGAAAAQYEALLATTGDEPRTAGAKAQARQRLAALRPQLDRAAPERVIGLLVSPEDIPAEPARAPWLEALAQAGITTLVLEAGTTARPPAEEDAGDPQAGVYFRTSWAPVIDDVFEQVIPSAREAGLAVYGAVTLRRMGWLEPPPGWADAAYDPETKEIRQSTALDLFHPGLQHYIEGLLLDLADSGVDGVLFRGDAPLGPFDGFSPYARAAFEEAFAVGLDAAHLVPAEPRGSAFSADQYPPDFWRWAGWKLRERLRLLARLADVLRTHRASIEVGLELHAAVVSEPVRSLVDYSEDLVETARAGFDYVVVDLDPESAQASASFHESTSTLVFTPGSVVDDAQPPLARLREVLQGDADLWLVTRTPDVPPATLAESLDPTAARATLPEAVGLLYVAPSLALP